MRQTAPPPLRVEAVVLDESHLDNNSAEFVLCTKGESLEQCVETLLRDVLLRCGMKR